MHAATLFLAAFAGLAVAQTGTTTTAAAVPTTSTGCGEIIDITIAQCLTTENNQLAACADQDWDCKCEQSKNVLVCYNNCPSDPRAFGAQQTSLSYCNAAAAYGTSTSSTLRTATATTSSSSGSATVATTTTTGSGFSQSSGTHSGSAATSSPTDKASSGAIAQPAGGALAAIVLGLFALL